MDRVCKSLLTDDQRKLLHIFPKENLDKLNEERKDFKLHRRLRESIYNTRNNIRQLNNVIENQMVDLDAEQYEAKEVREAYDNIKNCTDLVSIRILNSLDQEIISKLREIDRENEGRREGAIGRRRQYPDRCGKHGNRRSDGHAALYVARTSARRESGCAHGYFQPWRDALRNDCGPRAVCRCNAGRSNGRHSAR